MAEGLDKGALRDLHMLVEHVGPLPAGSHLFRTGRPLSTPSPRCVAAR